MAGNFAIVVSSNGLFMFDKRQLRKTMRQAGAEVANFAKGLVRNSSGGPGQPPKNRTGRLVRGIKTTMLRSGTGVRVYDDAQSAQGQLYAVMLEAGSKGGGPGNKRTGSHQKGKYQQHGKRVLTPRPFISLALQMREASIDARVKAAVDDGVAFVKVKP